MQIKTSVTRIVLLIGNYAIKFPKPFIWNHFLRGIIGNIEERRTYKWNSGKFETDKVHLLNPTLYCSIGGWFVIAKRTKSLTLLEWNNADISEHLEKIPGDDKIHNYGILNNRIVKIDYADLDNFWGEDFKNKK